MKMKSFLAEAVAISVLLGFARAEMPRVFVSAKGNDRQEGSSTLPKRTFAQAVVAVDPGGEVVVLDSGAYGPVTINKSVSIIAPSGVYAGVRGQVGVQVQAAAANVVLRGLTVEGGGNSSTGISASNSGYLHIEDCVINDFNEGIVFGGRGRLFVKDSALRGNRFSSIHLLTGRASIEHTRLEAGGHGLIAALAGALVTHSTIAGNTGTGVLVLDGSAVTMESCEVTDSQQDGVSVSGVNSASVLRLSNCTVTDNIGVGVAVGQGGILQTRGNNTVAGNSADFTGASAPLPTM